MDDSKQFHLFEINEKDFEEFRKLDSPDKKITSFGVDGGSIISNEEIIRKYLPKIIAKKVADSIPEGFELKQIQLQGQLSATFLGLGVSGNISVTFEKK